MLLTTHFQFNLIIYSFLSGILIGVLFDIYRIIRGFENPNKILTFIEDILFWILAAIIIFIFLFYTIKAYLSSYIYLFIILGLYIYLRLLSKPFISIEYKFLVSIGKVLRVLLNILFYPFQLFADKLSRKFKKNKNK